VSALAAVLTTAGGVTVAAWWASVGWLGRRLIGKVDSIAEQVGKVDDRLITVEAQHRNNGGATLRDAVDRIESNVNEQAVRLTGHLIDAAGDKAAFAAHIRIHS